MHHALGDAFAIEALQLLDQLHILQQYRAAGASGLRVLIVTDRSAVIAGQRSGIDREGQQAGGQYTEGAAMREKPPVQEWMSYQVPLVLLGASRCATPRLEACAAEHK